MARKRCYIFINMHRVFSLVTVGRRKRYAKIAIPFRHSLIIHFTDRRFCRRCRTNKITINIIKFHHIQISPTIKFQQETVFKFFNFLLNFFAQPSPWSSFRLTIISLSSILINRVASCFQSAKLFIFIRPNRGAKHPRE